MRTYNIYRFWTGVLCVCIAGCAVTDPVQEATFQHYIDSLQQVYAPDKRRALWDVSLQKDAAGLYLKGETDQGAAWAALRDLSHSGNVDIRDSLVLLPDTAALEEKLWGVVQNSVANLRGKPKHSSELVTQALLGTPLRLLRRQGSWFLVQTPDEYIAWADKWAFAAMSPEAFEAWLREKKLFYSHFEGYAYASPREEAVVSDMTMGAIVSRTGSTQDAHQGTHQEIRYPDGRQGWVRNEEVSAMEEFLDVQQTRYEPQHMRSVIPHMIGLPYLWGGTSVKGMDCSGFTKMLFFVSGWIIPRDASQQAEEGLSVDMAHGWESLREGDLLFFGRRDSTRSYVTHVGVWLGEGHFIHASGRVRLSSVYPPDAAYDSANLKRFLYAKRYTEPSARLIPFMRAGTYYKP